MNKRYLPAIAALLIVVTCTSFLPVFATLPTRLVAQPTLTVVTIPQDDQLRNTGVMWFAETQAAFTAGTGTVEDLMAQFKIIVSFNGLPVTPTNFYCQVIEKDKSNPLKNQQAIWENLVTVPKDESGNFICKWRPGKAGVGVLDVYFTGNAETNPNGLAWFISDYVLVVGASFVIGRSTVFGTEIQDICILGWPVGTMTVAGMAPAVAAYEITKPDGTRHWIYADPLGGFASCEDAALVEKAILGLPIPWT